MSDPLELVWMHSYLHQFTCVGSRLGAIIYSQPNYTSGLMCIHLHANKASIIPLQLVDANSYFKQGLTTHMDASSCFFQRYHMVSRSARKCQHCSFPACSVWTNLFTNVSTSAQPNVGGTICPDKRR